MTEGLTSARAVRPSLRERLANNADGILEQIARDYGATTFEVVEALPEAHRTIVGGDKFERILAALTTWGHVVFIVHSVVLDAVELMQDSQATAASVASIAGAHQPPKDIARQSQVKDVAVSEPPEVLPTAETPNTAEGLNVISGNADEPATISALVVERDATGQSRSEPQKQVPDRRIGRVEATNKPANPREMDKKPARREVAAANGSKASQASQGKTGSGGRISASRGNVLSYAAMVRARVASRRPAGNGARGRVVVSFSVTSSGGLGGTRILASSGNGALDSAALNAVRSAGPFPPPPAGPLSFAVPFYYR